MVKLTPKSNPGILEEWEEKERKLIAEGLSRYQAHLRISKEYKVSRDCIYYWLSSETHRQERRHYQLNYKRSLPDPEKVKKYDRNYNKLVRHLDWYLFQVLNGQIVIIDAISENIKKITGVSISGDTIERLVERYKLKTSEAPIVEIKKDLYKLNSLYYQTRNIKPVILE